eukprot:1781098-Rhodomonas_salina.4
MSVPGLANGSSAWYRFGRLRVKGKSRMGALPVYRVMDGRTRSRLGALMIVKERVKGCVVTNGRDCINREETLF